MLLASSGQRSEMLLNILRGALQPQNKDLFPTKRQQCPGGERPISHGIRNLNRKNIFSEPYRAPFCPWRTQGLDFQGRASTAPPVFAILMTATETDCQPRPLPQREVALLDPSAAGRTQRLLFQGFVGTTARYPPPFGVSINAP